jgi:hypothetical protein
MTLSAALFKRLYQTIEEGRKSDAVLLLTQVFDHQNASEEERQRAFLRGLRMLADEYQAEGNHEEAERHLILAVDLFNKFFDSDLREGLALNRRLCEFYERTSEEQKLKEQLDAAYVLVRRMLADVSTVALTGDMQRTGTSNNIADSSIDFVAEDKSAKALKMRLLCGIRSRTLAYLCRSTGPRHSKMDWSDCTSIRLMSCCSIFLCQTARIPRLSELFAMVHRAFQSSCLRAMTIAR